jgi:hypothetical protein
MTWTSGHALPWVTNVRYIEIHILCSQTFKCSRDQAHMIKLSLATTDTSMHYLAKLAELLMKM